MARGTYLVEDISIFLNEEEVIQFGQLQIDSNAPPDKNLSHKPLDVLLETQQGSTITARMQMEDFDDLGDGIRVERKDYGFLIRINGKAYWRIRDNPLSGTRYDGSNKIHFCREE